jgi:hypothetical protein
MDTAKMLHHCLMLKMTWMDKQLNYFLLITHYLTQIEMRNVPKDVKLQLPMLIQKSQLTLSLLCTMEDVDVLQEPANQEKEKRRIHLNTLKVSS